MRTTRNIQGAPTSTPFRSALRAELRELLREDPGFRREVADLIKSELAVVGAEFLCAEAFANLRHLHPDTVARMARTGRISGARKDGREWRLPADAEIAPAALEPAVMRTARAGTRTKRTTASSGAVDAMLAYARQPEAA